MSAPVQLVTGADEAADRELKRYAEHLANMRSIIVRPVADYEGIEDTTASVTALAPDPVWVSDLASPVDRMENHCSRSSLPDHERCDEPLVAFHTSGSTGAPKCVVYRRSHVDAHAGVVARSLELDAAHRYVALPPPRFAYGLSIVHSHLVAGVPVRFASPEWGLPGLVADDGPVTVYALPQHTPLLLSSELPADGLARLFIAGGRLSGASAEALGRRFPSMRLTNMYGQAEMGPRLTMWDGTPRDFVEGTIGAPIEGVDIDTSPAGELLARSDHAMSWSLRTPYTRLEPFGGDRELVPTGDLGSPVEAGWRHEGRADHVLNVAGTKVDMRRVVAIVTDTVHPLLVGVSSRATRTGGDVVPVVEIVPNGPAPRGTGPLRRALHQEFGGLAALFDLRYVEHLTLKESGK